MKNALILHGTWGNPEENWFRWLETELTKKGYKVWVPDLPEADKPDIPRYNKFIFDKWQFDSDSILIGHSSGAVAILGLLQELSDNVMVDKAILVAGFKDDLGIKAVKKMFEYQFDWDKIKRHSKKFIFIHSDNDPHVPKEHGEFLQEKLDGELVVLPGQGHFSVSTAGEKYKQFPELLKYIYDR
jgi:hypothetical protein